jgi:hypothetical protein
VHRNRRLSWARAWELAYATLWTLTIWIGVIVWAAPGGAGLARAVLGLSLSAARNPPPSLGAVVAIAVNNALHAGWPLALGPLGMAHRPTTRLLADVVVALNLAVCAVLVGTALGAYGARAVPFLPHLPLEWAGVAIGTAGWIVERRQPLRTGERAGLACALVAVLLVAGFVEVWAVPSM